MGRIIDRALAYDRTARWPDARTFQQAVREAAPLVVGVSSSGRPRAPSQHISIHIGRAIAVISAHTLRSGKSSQEAPICPLLFERSRLEARPRLWLAAGVPIAFFTGQPQPVMPCASRSCPRRATPCPPRRREPRASRRAPSRPKTAGRSPGPDLQTTLVESTVPDHRRHARRSESVAARKPVKPPKPGTKPPRTTPDPAPARSSNPAPANSSGDLFEKRH